MQHTRLISSSSRSCKTKVSDLKVKTRVEHDVLWLEVTMAHATRVHVLKRIHELVIVGAGNLLLEAAAVGHEIKKLSALSELQYNVVDHL